MLEVHIQLERRRVWTAADQRRLAAHERHWAEALGEDFSAYDLSALAKEEKPEIVIPLSDPFEVACYVVLVEALTQLEALFPDVKVRIWDGDVVAQGCSPSSVDLPKLGDTLRELLEEEGADLDALDMLDMHLAGAETRGMRRNAPLEDEERVSVDPALERAKADFAIWKKKR